MFDLVISGGTVLDGTGTPGRKADVGIEAGRIAAIGDLAAAEAVERVDATGQVVAPGFVDLHSHSDLTLLSAPGAPNKIRQGITAEVNGNCGMGGVPLPADQAVAIRRANAPIDPDLGVDWPWSDFES